MVEYNSKHNGIIDYLKFLAAVLVVYLHTVEQDNTISTGVLYYVEQCFHWAIWAINPVEVFLLISGFYFFSNTYNYEKHVFLNDQYTRRIKHYIWLYLGWSILYLPNITIRISELISKGNSVTTIILFVVKRLFISGTTGIMWYMLGVIYSLMLIRLLMKYMKDYAVSIIALLLYCISLLGGSYYHLLDNTSYLKRLFDIVLQLTGSLYLFRVPVFIMIGYYIKKSFLQGTIHIRKVYLVGWYFISVAALFLERKYCINHSMGIEYPAFLFTLFASTFLLLICLTINTKDNYISRFLGSSSSFIYFTHWQVVTIWGQSWESMIIAILIGIIGNKGYVTIREYFAKIMKKEGKT